MANTLVIVESPSKAKTIQKYLGTGYIVRASMGHVRDLPKKDLGVDVAAGFVPAYEVIDGKGPQVKQLRQLAKEAQTVLLAADPDREGEAIAWHIAELLRLRNPQRVVFREITKGVVTQEVQRPRPLDRNLVHAQEARRVIDRLVGYQISPLLWRARRGTSAGRVQTVAVRLVVERDEEITAFVPVESWRVVAELQSPRGEAFTAQLWALASDPDAAAAGPDDGRGGEAQGGKEQTPKLILHTEAEAQRVMYELAVDAEGRPSAGTPPFTVMSVAKQERQRNAPQPHTTSTLQQDASARLRMGPKKTMSVAQRLYEGVELADGLHGLITYMRTDSVRVSDEAQDAARAFITAAYSEQYVGDGPRVVKGKDGVQDAHEAIRPTDVTRTPDSIAKYLSDDERKLYDLIWRRFVASRMAACRQAQTTVLLRAGSYVFRATGLAVLFDGFTKLWSVERKKDDSAELPVLHQGERCPLQELTREQHFTKPPARYTEATLIKALEEKGVGRPSTYASIIETIKSRGYVEMREQQRLHPTELGVFVVQWMKTHFPDVVDIGFTALIEQRLDEIEAGKRPYRDTLTAWYRHFSQALSHAETTMRNDDPDALHTGQPCSCGSGELMVREGQYGPYTTCSICDLRFNGAPTGDRCPQCDMPLARKQTKAGEMVACTGYPECTYVQGGGRSAGTAAGKPCPACKKGSLVRKDGQYGPYTACDNYPACSFRFSGEMTGEDCPSCGKPLAKKHTRAGSEMTSCTGYSPSGGGCSYIKPDGKGPQQAAAKKVAGRCPECGGELRQRSSAYGPFVGCANYPQCRWIKKEKRGAA